MSKLSEYQRKIRMTELEIEQTRTEKEIHSLSCDEVIAEKEKNLTYFRQQAEKQDASA